MQTENCAYFLCVCVCDFSFLIEVWLLYSISGI